MKNDSEQVQALLSDFDWALSEDCLAQGWCNQFVPFVAAGKPVLQAEYTDTGVQLGQLCRQADALGFNAILKNRELDAFRGACTK